MMTEKEMRKLSRADLLELLIAQVQENKELEMQVALLNAKLKSRQIEVRQAGSIAQAALELNRVFESAQTAADQYLQNIEKLQRDTEESCRQMLEDTQKRCLSSGPDDSLGDLL